MLAAGTNVQWLRDDLGLIATSDESDAVAAGCADTGGVVYVPALLGLGTPGLGLRRARRAASGSHAAPDAPRSCGRCSKASRTAAPTSSSRPKTDSGIAIPALRVDGGMTDNDTFVQALADAAQRPVEISPMREATSRGAALMAGLAVGHHDSVDDLAHDLAAPRARRTDSACSTATVGATAVSRARDWIPELSGIDF